MLFKQFKIKQRGGFFDLLLGTLGASLLGNLLADKGVMRSGERVIATSESETRHN